MFDVIYCISGKGTAWENKEVRSRLGVDDILCLPIHESVYYCPDLHVIFYRSDNHNTDAYYSWDYAEMKAYDEKWRSIKQEPFWKTHVCHIDAPKPQPMTEEEVLAVL